MSSTSDAVHPDETIELEILELEHFEPAFAMDSDSEASTKRRFMTLFVEQLQSGDAGGSGYVSKARNAENQVFAIKRPMPAAVQLQEADSENGQNSFSNISPAQRAAFREEYRSLLSLSHMKGFPRLYGLGESRGNPVMVMEWVEGESLEEARSKLPCGNKPGTLSQRAVAAIGSALFTILDGLDRLVDRPVHRDISPRNIMIRTNNRSIQEQIDSENYDLCLVDFGSATAPNDVNPRITMQANIWRHGTPEYAPPEMLTHDKPGIKEERLSPSIDVYAASSVLFELLLGHTPFELSLRDDLASPYVVKTEEAPHLGGVERDAFLDAILAGLEIDQEKRPSPARMLEACERILGREGTGLADTAARGIRNEPAFETRRLDAPAAGLGDRESDARQHDLSRKDVWCLECGAKNEWWAQYCRSCGANLPAVSGMSVTQAIEHGLDSEKKGFSVGAIVSVAIAAVAVVVAAVVVLWTMFPQESQYLVCSARTVIIPSDDSGDVLTEYQVFSEPIDEAMQHGFSLEDSNDYQPEPHEEDLLTVENDDGFVMTDTGIEAAGQYVVTIVPSDKAGNAASETALDETSSTPSGGAQSNGFSFIVDYSPESKDAVAAYKVSPKEVHDVDGQAEDSMDAAVDSLRYKAYLAKAKEYIDMYGEGTTATSGSISLMDGVCLLDLVDFDGNGEEELLIVYRDSSQNQQTADIRNDYIFEVWSYGDDDEAIDIILKDGMNQSSSDNDAAIDLIGTSAGTEIHIQSYHDVESKGVTRFDTYYSFDGKKFTTRTVEDSEQETSAAEVDQFVFVGVGSSRGSYLAEQFNKDIAVTDQTLEKLGGTTKEHEGASQVAVSDEAMAEYRKAILEWGGIAERNYNGSWRLEPDISSNGVYACVELDGLDNAALIIADPDKEYRIASIFLYEDGSLTSFCPSSDLSLYYCSDGLFRAKCMPGTLYEPDSNTVGGIYCVGRLAFKSKDSCIEIQDECFTDPMILYPLETITWYEWNSYRYYGEGIPYYAENATTWVPNKEDAEIKKGNPNDMIAALENKYPLADDIGWKPLLAE